MNHNSHFCHFRFKGDTIHPETIAIPVNGNLSPVISHIWKNKMQKVLDPYNNRFFEIL